MTAPVTPDPQVPHRTRRGLRLGLIALLSMGAVSLCLSPVLAPSAGAQAGATTTTDPVDNRRFGDIIPKPNSGKAPETAGDPGGWLQVSLFFLICAAVVAIVFAVWRQSRRARARRAAAGLDPVELAKQRGEGVRQPR